MRFHGALQLSSLFSTPSASKRRQVNTIVSHGFSFFFSLFSCSLYSDDRRRKFRYSLFSVVKLLILEDQLIDSSVKEQSFCCSWHVLRVSGAVCNPTP